MAAELGKLAGLISKDSKSPLDSSSHLISSTSLFLLDRKKIPIQLSWEEGKSGSFSDPDTLASIVERLEKLNYREGAAFLRGFNKGLNDSGLLTDEKQKELVAKAKELNSK